MILAPLWWDAATDWCLPGWPPALSLLGSCCFSQWLQLPLGEILLWWSNYWRLAPVGLVHSVGAVEQKWGSGKHGRGLLNKLCTARNNCSFHTKSRMEDKREASGTEPGRLVSSKNVNLQIMYCKIVESGCVWLQTLTCQALAPVLAQSFELCNR